MGVVLSIIGIAALTVLIVVSMRMRRAAAAQERAGLQSRIGLDGAQHERSMARRAEARAAHKD
jgi:type II secretory pathway pseudopilin PulG